MWRRFRAGALLLPLLAAVVAGCVGEETPPPESRGSEAPAVDDPPPGNNTTKDGVLEQAETAGAVFAPDWQPGWHWTYAVDGAFLDNSYTATLGVVAVEADRYVLGASADEELMTAVVHGGGLFLGGIQRADLAVLHAGEAVDLTGFARAPGTRWDVTLFGRPFTLQKLGFQDVEHAKGTARGILVNGTSSGGHSLVVEYASDVGAVTLFDWRDAEGDPQVRYALTDWGQSGAPELRRWDVTDDASGSASGSPNWVGAGSWDSDGSGGALFLRILADNATLAFGRILDPMGQERLVAQATATERGVATAVVPDLAGRWTMVAAQSNDGKRTDAEIYQVQVLVGAAA